METSNRILELFTAATELPQAELAPFLERECAGQPALRAELESLLQADRLSLDARFLHQPPQLLAALQSGGLPRPFDRAGQLFGRYRILNLLGAGGMGEVYLAEDTDLHRQVALKLIKTTFHSDQLLDHFSRERQILAHLNHENIARLLDVGTAEGGVPFLVMEYVKGQPLDEYCNSRALSISARLALFRTICAAVQYAHQNLVVHRDLKPSNILVTPEGQVKLLDFGIAKLIDGEMPGPAPAVTLFAALTPEYASPEQIRGEATTTATDIYSLGVVLYQLLTGRGPYQLKRRTAHEMVQAICEQEPRRPSTAPSDLPAVEGSADAWQRRLRGDLDHIVLKALRKEPQQRYATVDQFLEDIRRHVEGLPVTARRATISYRSAKFFRRNKIAVAAAAALLCGAVATAWSAHVVMMQRAADHSRLNEIRTLAHSVLFEYDDAIATLPGSTPVRGRLVSGALAYLDRIARESDSDASVQLELASAYLRGGDVQGRPYSSNLGQTEGALTSYNKALAILTPITATYPKNHEARRLQATAHERIGNIELRKAEFAQAAASHRKAIAIRQQLLQLNPADAGSRGELAASFLYLGDALQADCSHVGEGIGCLRNALDMQRKALAMREELSRENPADAQLQRDLAQADMRVGFRLRDLALWTADQSLLLQSVEAQTNALHIREQVAAANPANVRDRRNVADQLMILGEVQAHAGDHASAFSGYRKALATFQTLSAADPANAEARRDLSFGYFRLAQEYAIAGNPTAAQKNYDDSLACAQQLLANDPGSDEDRRTIVAVYALKSDLAAKTGDYPHAIEYYSKIAEDRGYYPLGRLNVDAAQYNRTPAEERPRYWRAARKAYQHNLELLQKKAGRLDDGESNELKAITQGLALCDAALKVGM